MLTLAVVASLFSTFGKFTALCSLVSSVLLVSLTCLSDIYSFETYPIVPFSVFIFAHPFSTFSIVTFAFLVNVVIILLEVLAPSLTFTILGLINPTFDS